MSGFINAVREDFPASLVLTITDLFVSESVQYVYLDLDPTL